MIRVAGLDRRAAAGLGAAATGGSTPTRSWVSIASGRRARPPPDRRVPRRVQPLLADARGPASTTGPPWKRGTRRSWAATFGTRSSPSLIRAVGRPRPPSPTSPTCRSLAIMVRDPQQDERRFARSRCPPLLPRFVRTADGAASCPWSRSSPPHLDRLFPGMEIELPLPVPVTRNADLSVATRSPTTCWPPSRWSSAGARFGHAVRLEIHRACRGRSVTSWCGARPHPRDVYEIDGFSTSTVCGRCTGSTGGRDPEGHALAVGGPAPTGRREEGTVDISPSCRRRACSSSTPTTPSPTPVQAFIRQAAVDPQAGHQADAVPHSATAAS